MTQQAGPRPITTLSSREFNQDTSGLNVSIVEMLSMPEVAGIEFSTERAAISPRETDLT
ncbi:hypothetical protein M1B35_22390 [Pseudomonas sp. MAFF 302046]|uniref:Phage tail protein n=1 Tax=Pseudomonas morbosilactucae TaxID=2938197 RepID=A0ABT0JLI9_9PSED|nr:hypothetical protein [Pseudomonas morbosilactucae]MCK9816799.1 hypothetical protein [Pseudomonas morbosilactucae]